MELLHRANDVTQMFDHVNGRDAAEAIVGKGIWKFLQIGQNVGMARRIAVDADRSGLLADPAAHIEHKYRRARRDALRLRLRTLRSRF